MSDAGTQQDKATLTIGDQDGRVPAAARHRRRPERRHLDASRGRPGHTTLDYGFVNTAATKSAITFIDGDQGILRYRGYPIEQLAHEQHLPRGRLAAHLRRAAHAPTSWPAFDERIRHHTLLHEDLKRFFSALPHTAHPMSVLSSAISALSTYYENESDPNNPEHVELNTIRMLAKLPVIAAYAHKKSIGQAFLYPDNSLELRRQLPQAQLRRAVASCTRSTRSCRARSSGC